MHEKRRHRLERLHFLDLQKFPGELEIAEAGSEGKITGKLLQKKTEEIYTRTATAVTVQSNRQTKIVMGKPADVHAGAVVHVTGTVQKDQVIAADQIVILTGYVKVQSE